MKISVIIAFFFLFFSSQTLTEEKSREEKEKEIIDFEHIKKFLKNDNLDDEALGKSQIRENTIKRKREKQVKKFDIPPSNHFWSFFSEYWLIKNVTQMKWDFKKPDYGINEFFELFLEKLGYYEKRFNILLVDTPRITHMALPSDKEGHIFILSLPFMKILDLSKLEISLILFEDYLRLKGGYFKRYVVNKEAKIKDYLGGNFYKEKKIDKDMFNRLLKKIR